MEGSLRTIKLGDDLAQLTLWPGLRLAGEQPHAGQLLGRIESARERDVTLRAAEPSELEIVRDFEEERLPTRD
jgi:hypothetical protein